MANIFSTSCLKPLLSQLTIRSKDQIVGRWEQKHRERALMQMHTFYFGQSCTLAMAKCLDRLDLSYDLLKSFADNSDNRQTFYDQLNLYGFTRKAWCEKLWEHFNKNADHAHIYHY